MFKRTCVLCSAVAYCCGAVAPCAIAALLGRFLPRLGPLANQAALFSWRCHSSFPACHSFFTRCHAGFTRKRIQEFRVPSCATMARIFFDLFGGGLERSEIAERHGGQRLGQRT